MEKAHFPKQLHKIFLGKIERAIIETLLQHPANHYLSFSEIMKNTYEDSETKHPDNCLWLSLKSLLKKGLITKKLVTYKSTGKGGKLHETFYTMDEANRALYDYICIDVEVDRKFIHELFDMLKIDSIVNGEKTHG